MPVHSVAASHSQLRNFADVTTNPALPSTRTADRFSERLATRRESLSPSLLKVADYLNDNRHRVLTESALDIALKTGTSDATVIRAVQALGFGGLLDLKEAFRDYLLITASPSQKMAATVGGFADGVDSAIDFMLADLESTKTALGSPENRHGMAEISRLLASANRIGVFGIGASGIIAEYAARLFTRCGYPAFALNRTGISLAEQLIQLASGDVVLMMAHGRAHREAQALIAETGRLEIPIAMILTSSESVLLKHAAASMILPRRKSQHVAMHAPMLYGIETIMLGLASTNPDRAVETLDRLIEIRDIIRPAR
tara:strand:+ start:7051 stop:7992 length:942 start_codon:yes stop_codon:yes gene_type:complete